MEFALTEITQHFTCEATQIINMFLLLTVCSKTKMLRKKMWGL